MSVETRRYQNRREFVGAHNPEGPYSLRVYDDGTAQLGEGNMYVKKTKLSNAAVLTLATGSGVEAIPAPGANKAIIVVRWTVVADAAAGAWVEPDQPDDIILQYADGVDITAALDATPLVAADVAIRTIGVIETLIDPDVNAAVNIFNPNSQWTGGNVANSLSSLIAYYIVDTVAFDSAR